MFTIPKSLMMSFAAMKQTNKVSSQKLTKIAVKDKEKIRKNSNFLIKMKYEPKPIIFHISAWHAQKTESVANVAFNLPEHLRFAALLV